MQPTRPRHDIRRGRPHRPAPAPRRSGPSGPIRRTVTTTVTVAAALSLALTGLTACRPVQVEGRAGSTPVTAPTSPGSGRTASAPAAQPSRTAAPSPTRTRPAVLMAKGARSAQVRELQARLRALSHFQRSPTGYYGDITAGAVTAFQRAHGMARTGSTDTVTWQRLVALTRPPTHDELYPPTTLPISKPDPRCMTGRALCISKKSRTLAWMVGGTTRAAMDVRFGSEYTPTREGAFTVYWKSRHHVSTIYHTAMPYAMFFSGGQAIHYSADFAARGYSGASHGCVNVRDEQKIATLFNQVTKGDKVIIY